MTQYQDIYIRDFVGDTGQIPSTTRLNVNLSPDIIPVGQSIDPGYQTIYANNYDGPYNYYSDLIKDAYNYIVVRGYNAAPQATSGTINLYWAKASILLLPSQWIANSIPNVNGTTSATIAMSGSGQVAVASDAFYFAPSGLTDGDHYCLIAQTVTTQDPDPIPQTLTEFASWVANNPGIGWRNCALRSASVPSFSTFVALETPPGAAADITLAITCTNIPDGVQCGLVGSQPSPAIDFSFTVGPDNQTSSSGATPKINQAGPSPYFGVPGGFLEKLQLTVNANGQTITPGSSVAFQCFLNVGATSELARYGRPASELRIEVPREKQATAGVMVLLGEFAVLFD